MRINRRDLPGVMMAVMTMLLTGLGPVALGGDLESYSYHPNFLNLREQSMLQEHWKTMDLQAARRRILVEQAQKSCNTSAFHSEMNGLKDQILQMLSSLRKDYPEQAREVENQMKHFQQISPVVEKSLVAQQDIVLFHMYFYNRLLNESEQMETQCVTQSADTVIVNAFPTMKKEDLQQEVIHTVAQVHKMTTYMDDVLSMVKQCQQTQYNTYLDPLEQLSERILVLRKEAQIHAGQNNDDSLYSLMDRMFDEVMSMRRQMETAWQQGQCMQAVSHE